MKATTRTQVIDGQRFLVVSLGAEELRLSYADYHSGVDMFEAANLWVLERGGSWR